MVTRTIVVATAGHVDHGKTSLVRALTGVDLDTRPEERERGITIALGFVHLDLPGVRIAFVDVPGHERFVRTMVAGVHGVDAALLVVSAAEGVMPQTREHVQILDLLGVTAGVVALTHADRVDADLLELARLDVAELLRDTALAAAPVLAVSSVTGDGLDGLRAALGALDVRPRDASTGFRLPIDRVFTRPGFGTVVTGTSISGTLVDGASVRLLPGTGTARVRGLRVHGQPVDAVGPGTRVAVNLSGVERDLTLDGLLLTTDEVPCPSVIDVHYRHVEAEVPVTDGLPVRVHAGTTSRDGRLHLADPAAVVVAGEEVYAQLRLDGPLPVLPGDRLVLRRPSPAATLGGAVVLDPWATRLRARDATAWSAALARLHHGDPTVWLERAGLAGLPEAHAVVCRLGDVGVSVGGRRFSADAARTLDAALLDAVDAFHRANPLTLGVTPRELARGPLAALDGPTFDAWVGRAVQAGELVLDVGRLRRTGFSVVLDAATAARRARVEAAVLEAGVEGLEADGLRAVDAGSEALVRLLEHDGTLVRVPDLGWVHRDVTARVRDGLREVFAHDPSLTPAAFRDRFGLSRRTTLPWLTWTDRQGWTRRDADGRQAGPML